MTYCYLNLEVSLQSLLLDPKFSSECELWKTRSSDECLKDVYDGRVWKQFMDYKGEPFLRGEQVYAFMINIDWFQPYKHLTYSVGAIYLSVFNLPRQSRYKLHNICLVGIIPGPCEPELTVNQYIKPLIEELKDFWSGREYSCVCCNKRAFVGIARQSCCPVTQLSQRNVAETSCGSCSRGTSLAHARR